MLKNIEYNCTNCAKIFKHSYSSTNKYCSQICSAEGSKKLTFEKFLVGLVNSPKTVKECVIQHQGNICNICGLSPEWNGKPLVLQLDHIDGDSDNNFPSNLRLLCPNCHSQTETFGSKGKGSRYKKISKRNLYLRDYKSE